jgi:hypothetical protein
MTQGATTEEKNFFIDTQFKTQSLQELKKSIHLPHLSQSCSRRDRK